MAGRAWLQALAPIGAPQAAAHKVLRRTNAHSAPIDEAEESMASGPRSTRGWSPPPRPAADRRAGRSGRPGRAHALLCSAGAPRKQQWCLRGAGTAAFVVARDARAWCAFFDRRASFALVSPDYGSDAPSSA